MKTNIFYKPIMSGFVVLLILQLSLTVFAHPGKTDSSGGHTSHSTGEYHYHHGYSAHSHYDMDGDGGLDCPYDFKDQTDDSSSAKSKSSKYIQSQTDSKNSHTKEPASKKNTLWEDTLPEIFCGVAFCFLILSGITRIFSKNIAEICFTIFYILLFLSLILFT